MAANTEQDQRPRVSLTRQTHVDNNIQAKKTMLSKKDRTNGQGLDDAGDAVCKSASLQVALHAGRRWRQEEVVSNELNRVAKHPPLSLAELRRHLHTLQAGHAQERSLPRHLPSNLRRTPLHVLDLENLTQHHLRHLCDRQKTWFILCNVHVVKAMASRPN